MSPDAAQHDVPPTSPASSDEPDVPATWRRLVSDDGSIGIALHRFAGPDDPTTATTAVIVSHATGFHAHCYQAIAAALPEQVRRDVLVVGIDHRGHGYTAPNPNAARVDGLPVVDWRRFGDDIDTLVTWLAGVAGVPRIVGYGHSMGASALVLAAARRPESMARLILFEPIAPSGFYEIDPSSERGAEALDSPLARGALRRRRTFGSYGDAIANYAAKPPFSIVRPDVLEAYVRHGFAPCPDGITLRCTPEYESATFVAAMTNGVWEAMPSATTPTVVVAGSPLPESPGEFAPAVADHMPDAALRVFDDQGHFGPFTDPDTSAQIIVEALADGDGAH